jgi:Fe-S-cluster-containing hydrogenase component 2
MKRKIVQINEELCNGCGLCVNACHEGAIEMIDGKARLVSDQYCDGLGDCLPACPTDAIQIIEREAEAYNEELVEERMKERQKDKSPIGYSHMGGCPGSMAKKIEHAKKEENKQEAVIEKTTVKQPSQLQQWPVQISLVNPRAEYLKGADLLIAADCTAYAYADFHKDFIKDHITMIGCPKLDDNQYYTEKLTEIFKSNEIKSITVTRMEVPCCGGIIHAVKQAMLNAQTIVPYREVVIGIDGNIVNR